MSASAFLSKAQSALAAAQILLTSGLDDDACSRAYYAMFDAARAALAASDAPVTAENARTHSGLISAFNLYLIKTGKLSPVHGNRIGQAHQARLIADYHGDPVSSEKAGAIAEWAAELIEDVKAVFEIE